MTEHYVLYEINKLTDRFGLTNGVPKGVKPRYNISPTQMAPVIINHDGAIALQMMQWGFVPNGAKDANSVFRYKTFNVKSEKVFSKPIWDTAVRHRRCIIPANGFFSLRVEPGTKDAYYFSSSEQSLLGLAGICTTWVDVNGTERDTFSLLTVESNESMPLPFRRMPVILQPEDEQRWLDSDVHDATTLVPMMRAFTGAPLQYHAVSAKVASAKNDTPMLIEPVKR